MATLENREGYFIAPTLKAFQVSAEKASLKPKKDFYAIIADPSGAKSYPMVAATFILVPAEHKDMDKKVTKFFAWAYKNGQTIAKDLGYVPLPAKLTKKVKSYWSAKCIH